MSKTVLTIGDEKFAGSIKDMLSPLAISIISDTGENEIESVCKLGGIDVIIYDDDGFRCQKPNVRLKILTALQESKKDFIIISSRKSISAVREAMDFGARDIIIRPFNYREFFSRFRAILEKKSRILCMGGGTGLFHILMGLKKLPNVLLTSVVSMSDDGGSSGKLRTSFGILPPGDIRRSLVALSNAPQIMNELMQFRFQRGGHFSGHNLGNLFLTALSEIKGSVPEAVRTISDILNTQGIVFPVTARLTTLCARFEDDTVVKGESKIDLAEDRHPDLSISEIWHEPKTKCTTDAFSSIVNSDYVIIGPGDLYTSVVTNLLVGNIAEALTQSKAKRVYICNLMTKPGETANYNACDHIAEIIKYMGGDYLDFIILSNSKLSSKSIDEYAQKHQIPVSLEGIEKVADITKAKVIIADVGHETELVRHDSIKIMNEVIKLIGR